MKAPNPTTRYKRHRFPAEIISHGVWLNFRFCLSYRDVEQLMAARGVMLTYETVRYWCRKFGQVYANQLRCRRPKPDDKWHFDEVFLTMQGQRHDLWRAVDQEGNILDILVQRQRERRMQRFKSPGQAQRFLAAYDPIAQHFRPRRYLLSASAYHQEIRQRFQSWREVTGLAPAA